MREDGIGMTRMEELLAELRDPRRERDLYSVASDISREASCLVEPPLDADGRPWRIGDAADLGERGTGAVSSLVLDGGGWRICVEHADHGTWSCGRYVRPEEARHADSWERLESDVREVVMAAGEPERAASATAADVVARAREIGGSE